MTRASVIVLSVLATTATPVHALAQTAPDASAPPPLSGAEVTLAETLYREGRRLMAEQRYAEASLKFAESHRLDPATGTLLNLATCYEAQGKLASAWLTFSEALRAGRREQREDRVQFAEGRIREIEPKLSRLTVEVSQENVDGLTVKLDGVVIGPAAYGVASPIDPGKHRVEASALGYESWSTDVVIGASADRQLVNVPKLSPVPVPAPPPQKAPEPAPVLVPPLLPAPSVDSGLTTRPVPASVYVAGTATLILTAGAIVSGVAYVDKRSEYSTLRRDPDEPLGLKQETRDDAKTWGFVNLGLTAGALAGAGLTAFLYSSRPERPLASAGVPRVAPWCGPQAGGLTYRSEF